VFHSREYFRGTYGAVIIHSIENSIDMYDLFSYRILRILIQFSLLFFIPFLHFLLFPCVFLKVICSYCAFIPFFLTCYLSLFLPFLFSSILVCFKNIHSRGPYFKSKFWTKKNVGKISHIYKNALERVQISWTLLYSMQTLNLWTLVPHRGSRLSGF
jgi:hypothetical protein